MDVLTAKNKWVSWAMVAAVVAIFLLSIVIGTKMSAGAEEPFGGTDAAATQAAEDAGADPWFTPFFEPAGEVESGLFAIQAAIGAGIIGYALGRMGGRKAALAEVAKADTDGTVASESAETGETANLVTTQSTSDLGPTVSTEAKDSTIA